jgi:predicted amidohydrolase YtcJ
MSEIPRDAVLTGRVLPLSGPKRPDAAAVATRGGRIEAVGADAASAALPRVDFGGRPILPGFVDPHAHVEVACTARAAMVDCRAPRHGSVADVVQELADAVRSDSSTEWLVGQANLFFDQKLSDKRLPTREELDSVSRERPIALRCGGHTTVLNSRAFESTGVARYAGGSGMMGGAVVEVGDDGQPTGVISELDAALGLPELSRDELKTALRDGVRDLFTAYGVTTMGEISDTVAGLELMDQLAREGDLPGRVSVYLWAPGTLSIDQVCSWRDHLSLTSDRMSVRGLKLFSDGGYSARNAATRTPYLEPYALEPGSMGKIDLDAPKVVDAIHRTRAAGLQLAIHANGERAQDEVVAATLEVGPDPQLPVRIEHAGNLLTKYEATESWRRAGIVPMPQAVFLYNFGDFFPVYLGEEGGGRGRFHFKSLIADGWEVSSSSDVHLGAEESQTSPMFGVWCAVQRRSFLGDHIEPDQAVDVDQALLMHTLWAADAVGERATRGSIEAGKLADLVVLDRDPREVPPDELRDVQVDYVFVQGELVHRRPGAAPFTVESEMGKVHA